jgi:hypothetical protein
MIKTPETTESAQANDYALQCADIHIHYSATSIAGVPLLTYQAHKQTRSFRGEEIRVQQTELGDTVTVTLEVVPDLHTVTLTLLIPAVNLGKDNAARIATQAIRTTSRTSIGGPRLVQGQIQLYEALALEGTAKSVVS